MPATKASMRTVPIVSKNGRRIEVLASEVLELMAPLLPLYTVDGTDGGLLALYISDETLE